jgi:hypothetical protein
MSAVFPDQCSDDLNQLGSLGDYGIMRGREDSGATQDSQAECRLLQLPQNDPTLGTSIPRARSVVGLFGRIS